MRPSSVRYLCREPNDPNDMSNAFFRVPPAVNEPVRDYAPGAPETQRLQAALTDLKQSRVEIASIIGGRTIESDQLITIRPPHELSVDLGVYHRGSKDTVEQAIEAASAAKAMWAAMPWEERAAIFLKAADLLAGPYRDRMNAATMLGQSKNVFQAEIDAACEMIDFFRFNVEYMTEIYADQPISSPGVWNRMEYRPLEGFVFAVTPFNFTSICANLPMSPALMGNTVVWKPSVTQVYSAQVIMDLFRDAGLPDGVINMVIAPGPDAGEVCFGHPDFAGIHFTGSTGTFQFMWETIGGNIRTYRSYPRIVGETGGKDFVVAHPTSDPEEVATALARGAFEYQGQKCSAASRAYIPSNIWPAVKDKLLADIEAMKMGVVDDFSNFVNAVIDETAYDNITGFIEQAIADGQEILAGGDHSKEEGYFVPPTVIRAKDPLYTTMKEEIFGPVLTIWVYDEDKWRRPSTWWMRPRHTR